MDILRKELDEIYKSQLLSDETLESQLLENCCTIASDYTRATGGCAVITDAAADSCYIYGSRFAELMGLPHTGDEIGSFASSDEDLIYARLHPQDLPDKRLLEYEYFKKINPLSAKEKRAIHASCRIRIMASSGEYLWFDNTTCVIGPSPLGKIWLIQCTYNLSSNQSADESISPALVDVAQGNVVPLQLSAKRDNILTRREKEILKLIKAGKLSKEIADKLAISINTVNRHRQNILEKLSVDNSMEAVMAATDMRLL